MFSRRWGARPIERSTTRRVIRRSSELLAVTVCSSIAVLAAGASRRLGRAKQLVPMAENRC